MLGGEPLVLGEARACGLGFLSLRLCVCAHGCESENCGR